MSGLWLALDTATEIASVAVGRPPAAESGAHVQGARRHAAEIIRLVDFVLSRLRLRPRDLEGVGAGDGPGSSPARAIGWSPPKGLPHQPAPATRAPPPARA